MLELITVGYIRMVVNNSSAEKDADGCVYRRGAGALIQSGRSVF